MKFKVTAMESLEDEIRLTFNVPKTEDIGPLNLDELNKNLILMRESRVK